jgi:hypothetical protein
MSFAALVLSGAYRLVRNPGDFMAAPMHTLPAARQTVLERFGEYIPADSTCHQTPAKLSFDLALREGGGYPAHLPVTQLPVGLAQGEHAEPHVLDQLPQPVPVVEGGFRHR